MGGAAAGTAEAHEIVAGLLVRDGRVLLCHRSASRRWFQTYGISPVGMWSAGNHPPSALIASLKERLG